MANIFVITGTEIEDPKPGTLNSSFMFASKAPFPEFGDISSKFGYLIKTDIWKLIIVDTNAGGVAFSKWRSSKDDLLELVLDAVKIEDSFVVLMSKATYDQLAPFLQKENLVLGAHHFEGVLKTS